MYAALTQFILTGFRDDCWSTQFHKAGCGTNNNSGLEALSIALHNICDAMKTYMVMYVDWLCMCIIANINLFDSWELVHGEYLVENNTVNKHTKVHKNTG